MTESISNWSFRAAAALFAISFFASLWFKSLQRAPTRDDVADQRFEVRMTARYDRRSLVQYGLFAMANPTAPPSIRKDNFPALAAHSASRFHLPTTASLAH
jgi:hypothetical protein